MTMAFINVRILLLAQIIGGIYAEQNRSVTVNAEPSTVTPDGQDVMFTCLYTGFTPPDKLEYLTWYFMTTDVYTYNSIGNQEIINPRYKNRITAIQLSNTTMSFRLSEAGLCDAGAYTCRVYAKYPYRYDASITLTKENIKMKLEIHIGGIGENTCVSCKPEKRVITLKNGETSNIRCVAIHTPSPGPVLRWINLPKYEGISSLYEYVDKERCIYGEVNKLEIQQSTEVIRNGVYFQCVAEFTDGTEVESDVIQVKGPHEDIPTSIRGESNNITVIQFVLIIIVAAALGMLLPTICRRRYWRR